VSNGRRLDRVERVVWDQARRDEDLPVPHDPGILEFISNPAYLGRLPLLPLQAFMLKAIFLVPEVAYTDFDRESIASLGEGFALRRDGDVAFYDGEQGTAPDVLERVRLCRDSGRRWLRDVIMVVGRRGGKGYVGAICAAYILWRYISDIDPHAHAGLDKSTQLTMLVFALTKPQARATQHKMIRDFIMRAPCFQPYIAATSRDSLMLYAHDQVMAGDRGTNVAPTFEILACGATEQDARGRTVIAAFFDEIAWMTGGGANRSAEEIYPAVIPALMTAGDRAFVYLSSSPWQPDGQLYRSYRDALAVDPTTGAPLHPQMWTLQLPTWAISTGWELTVDGTFEITPGGPTLPPKQGPLVPNESLDEERSLNPETYDIEFGAKWATARNPYFNPSAIHAIFTDADVQPSAGRLGTTYFGYADPGLVDDHFAFVIAHLEHDDTSEIPHVVFDVIEDWDPKEHPGNAIDTEWAIDELFGYLLRFRLTSLTMDQFNGRAIADGLRRRIRDAQLNWHPQVTVRQNTRAQNYQIAETFKRLAYAGHITALMHMAARDQLLGLRDNHGKIEAATTGRVTKDDIAIAMLNVVSIMTEPFHTLIHEIGALKARITLPGGLPIEPPPPLPGLGRDRQPNPYGPAFTRAGRPRPPSRLPSQNQHGRAQFGEHRL
jgi:hypothetical protein